MSRIRQLIFSAFIFLGFALLSIGHSAKAAELLMFESPGCEWCDIWDAEIGQIYHKTDEGRRAPLRRISIHQTLPADLGFVKGVVYTPTFVLVDDGRELGRILGYPGEMHFWGLLEEMLPSDPEMTETKSQDSGA